MIFEDNRGIVVLSVTILTTVIATGFFMYSVRPSVMIIAKGAEEKIELAHQSGNELYWEELKISVTSGRNSDPVFCDPSDNRICLGVDNQSLSTIYDTFKKKMSVDIHRTSSGEPLVEENQYHVVIEHHPSNLTLVDMNARVKKSY